MKEDKLGDLSMELSVEVINLCKKLKSEKETVISNQIGRSASSVCANIAEVSMHMEELTSLQSYKFL